MCPSILPETTERNYFISTKSYIPLIKQLHTGYCGIGSSAPCLFIDGVAAMSGKVEGCLGVGCMPILRTAQAMRLHHLYCGRCTNDRPASLPVALPANAESTHNTLASRVYMLEIVLPR